MLHSCMILTLYSLNLRHILAPTVQDQPRTSDHPNGCTAAVPVLIYWQPVANSLVCAQQTFQGFPLKRAHDCLSTLSRKPSWHHIGKNLYSLPALTLIFLLFPLIPLTGGGESQDRSMVWTGDRQEPQHSPLLSQPSPSTTQWVDELVSCLCEEPMTGWWLELVPHSEEHGRFGCVRPAAGFLCIC